MTLKTIPRHWIFLYCFHVLSFFLLRNYLWIRFNPHVGTLGWLAANGIGLWFDAWIALGLLLPWIGVHALWPKFANGALSRVLRMGYTFGWVLFYFFSLFSEYFFFEEFNSRFNTVAVDYLIYPHEVFINIWESYPIARILVLSAFVAATICWFFRRAILDVPPSTWKKRIGFAAGAYALFLSLYFLHPFAMTRYNDDRRANEIASNGIYSFFYAAVSRDLDYKAYYPTIDLDEAYRTTRAMLPGEFGSDPRSIQRRIGDAPNGGRKPKNVVLILVESFGSEFWGSLGRKGVSLTPRMDELSRDGILFTHVYASGNRTVRGLEGVLSSFPPLPSDSIVKRTKSDNVETVARLLKRDGFETVFFYGGRGIFDGMRSYATANGYDRFVEQKDFANPKFTTIWGVSDEELFEKGVEDLRGLHEKGKPFLATFLTVSNHKPYTYPDGRIPERSEERQRNNAVKYTDWSIGHFFDLAKKEKFWNDTVFVVVADHGARVYGSQLIPIKSYEIPILVVGPGDIVGPARRVGTLGNSIDVSPTVLGFLGRPYDGVFFGHNLLAPGAEKYAKAVMNHNRNNGLLIGDRLVVMGMNQPAEYYQLNPATGEIAQDRNPKPGDEELKKKAISIFQVADDLYEGERYRVQQGKVGAR